MRYPMVQENVGGNKEECTRGSQDPRDIIALVRMRGKGEAERLWKKSWNNESRGVETC